MFLKDFFGDLFGFNDEIDFCTAKNTVLETNLNNTKNLLEGAYKDYTSLNTKYNTALKALELYEESEAAKYWNTKYPKANIEYCGRTFGTSKEKISLDVRLLITPQDYHIHNILKAKKLYLTDNDNNIDKTVIKIYRFIKNNFYKYAFDKDNYGISEYWEFPFEILEKKARVSTQGFDCDSWANFMASFYIASGIPAWKVRVVIGMTKLGGHSTIYVHSDEDNKFHHLNSTYGNRWSTYNKISDYPTTDDATTTDAIGIKDVWFSFNNLYAWHKFTSEAKKSYKKENEDFIIK